MRNKFLIFLATGVLAVCLLSGGCFQTDNAKITDWKDLFKIPAVKQQDDSSKKEETKTDTSVKKTARPAAETVSLQLYFANQDGTKLAVESRKIEKVEGIARRTIEELLTGPERKEYINIFPEGTKLLDINVRPDGECIVDLSDEATRVDNQEQEKLMVYSIANTLAQFPTIEKVKFRIDGKDVETLGGFLDLSDGVEPDFKI